MARKAVITDANSLLGSYLAAACLAFPESAVFCMGDDSSEQTEAIVSQTARRIAPEEKVGNITDQIKSRLHFVGGDFHHEYAELFSSLPDGARIDEIWYLSSALRPNRLRGAQADTAAIRSLIKLGATEFNYVGPAYFAEESEVKAAEEPHEMNRAANDIFESLLIEQQEIVEQCSARGIGYRIFRAPLIFDENLPLRGTERDGLFLFLAELYDLKGEIEERFPEYFDYQALRCWVPASASLNIIRAGQTAEIVLRIAGQPDTLNRPFNLASPLTVSFREMCERIGTVYGLSLLAEENPGSLNAIDRLFHERLKGFHFYFTSPRSSAGDGALEVVPPAPDLAPFDEQAQLAFFQAVRRSQDAARDARKRRIADMPSRLERRTIARGEAELTYYAGGDGEIPVVLINALGQGLQYWLRLIDNLIRRHRVIIWEPRGTVSPPHPFRLSDQVDDLEAILDRESASTCRLVGWCTGPKLAVEFYLRRPDAVAAMVFLNSAFKCTGSPKELDSDYERNFESLCRVLDRRPNMAASVMSSLRSSIPNGEPSMLEDADADEMAVTVLSMMNVDLKQHVLAPFQSESTVINYLRQVLDFWSYDAKVNAGRVQVPVLLIGSEYDQIASPAMSRATVQHFPSARYLQVQGATHYCLYDRPDLIAELIEAFFKDPEGLDGLDGEVKLIA